MTNARLARHIGYRSASLGAPSALSTTSLSSALDVVRRIPRRDACDPPAIKFDQGPADAVSRGSRRPSWGCDRRVSCRAGCLGRPGRPHDRRPCRVDRPLFEGGPASVKGAELSAKVVTEAAKKAGVSASAKVASADKAATPVPLRARASIIKLGGTLATAEARVFDKRDALIASGRGVCLTMSRQAETSGKRS